MITAVRELGEWLKGGSEDVEDSLIEPISEDRYPHIVILLITDEGWQIQLEECDTTRSKKLLYRRGSPRGVNYSPTAMITEPETTVEMKLFAWFRKILQEKKKYDAEEISLVEKMYGVIKDHKTEIIQQITRTTEELRGGIVLSVKFKDRYLKDHSEIVSIFMKMINEKENKISANNQVCSVCGIRSDKVMAGSSAFKFYTIDKPGFISGEFNEQMSWRNYPVCSSCNIHMQEGKRFIEKHLRFRFYGLNYLLIPQFIFGNRGLQSEIQGILMSGQKGRTLQSQSVEDTIAEEDDILGLLKEEEEDAVFHLLFLQKVQSAERILKHIEDVLPSRLQEIFQAKKNVEQKFPIKEKAHQFHRYHFGRVRTFFNKSDEGKRNSDLDKYFLEITQSVFQGNTIELHFLSNFFMREIRKRFVKEDSDYRWHVFDALMNIMFFDELNILKKGDEFKVSTNRFEELFAVYGSHLNRPESKGLFLLGSLTELLLRKQYNERKAKPFLKNLKGLKMHEKDFLGLLPKIQEKLQQYNSFDQSKRELASEISNMLLASKQGWKLSVDEMNFYFVSGMNLADHVSEILYRGKNNEVDSEEEVV